MSFSAEEVDKVVQYLGYPVADQVYSQVGSALSRAIGVSTAVEVRIRGYLKELDRINNEINDARPFASRTFQTTQSGSANYAPHMRMSTLRDEGRRYVGLLAKAVGLTICEDFFVAEAGAGGSVRYVRG